MRDIRFGDDRHLAGSSAWQFHVRQVCRLEAGSMKLPIERVDLADPGAPCCRGKKSVADVYDVRSPASSQHSGQMSLINTDAADIAALSQPDQHVDNRVSRLSVWISPQGVCGFQGRHGGEADERVRFDESASTLSLFRNIVREIPKDHTGIQQTERWPRRRHHSSLAIDSSMPFSSSSHGGISVPGGTWSTPNNDSLCSLGTK